MDLDKVTVRKIINKNGLGFSVTPGSGKIIKDGLSVFERRENYFV